MGEHFSKNNIRQKHCKIYIFRDCDFKIFLKLKYVYHIFNRNYWIYKNKIFNVFNFRSRVKDLRNMKHWDHIKYT